VFDEGESSGRTLIKFRTKKAILDYINFYEKTKVGDVHDYNARSPSKIPTPRMPEKFYGKAKKAWRGEIFHRGQYDILTRIAHKWTKIKNESYNSSIDTSNEIIEILEKNTENLNLVFKDFIGELVLNYEEN